MSPPKAKPLDFVVVGAQKAGTTAFFRYLQGHPSIFLPPAKEVPYFSHDGRYEAGWDEYVAQVLRPPDRELVWGKVTPQYMCDPVVPERMAAAMPDLRIVALLRNPIERAYSHYRMAVKRGGESRPFLDVITALAEDDVAEAARYRRTDDGSCYLAWGEYGRILARYLCVFNRSQILVLTSEELAATPGRVLDTTLEFIGLAGGYRPGNLEKRYHVGGSERRVLEIETAARRVAPIRWLWHQLPDYRRERLWFWYEQWNTKRSSVAHTMTHEAEAALAIHYNDDVRLLRATFGIEPEWEQFL